MYPFTPTCTPREFGHKKTLQKEGLIQEWRADLRPYLRALLVIALVPALVPALIHTIAQL
jgi:hypothetical protein